MNPKDFRPTPCDNCPHKDTKPTTPQRRIPYIIKDADAVKLVKLTPEQVDLLDYLENECMLLNAVSFEEADEDWVEV